MWEANKTQAAALESVVLGGAKRILGCLSKTCNGAVRGDMVIDTLQGHRDKNKVEVVAAMPGNRYPKELFNKEWNFSNEKAGRGSVGVRSLMTTFHH